MLAESPLAKKSGYDDVVRLTLPALISLNQSASSVSLWKGRIRSDQGSGYISSVKGRGMEFDEVRPYMPGDDVRSMDWRVTARTGKAHTKLFREERERPVLLGIDLREPMFFATRGVFKSVQACKLGALLAWKAHQNGDRVGGQIFGQNAYREIKPQNGQRAVLHFLTELVKLSDPAEISDPTGSHSQDSIQGNALESVLVRLIRHSRPGSSIVLVSDFWQLDQSCEFHMMHLAKHCDVILMLVFDPMEVQLPVKGRYRFSDGRHDITVNTSDRRTAENYELMFRKHADHLKTLALRFGMRFVRVSTTDDPVEILQSSTTIHK